MLISYPAYSLKPKRIQRLQLLWDCFFFQRMASHCCIPNHVYSKISIQKPINQFDSLIKVIHSLLAVLPRRINVKTVILTVFQPHLSDCRKWNKPILSR